MDLEPFQKPFAGPLAQRLARIAEDTMGAGASERDLYAAYVKEIIGPEASSIVDDPLGRDPLMQQLTQLALEHCRTRAPTTLDCELQAALDQRVREFVADFVPSLMSALIARVAAIERYLASRQVIATSESGVDVSY